MNNILRKIKKSLLFWGFDPRIFIYNLVGFPRYFKDYRSFRKITKDTENIKFGKRYPVLGDKYKPSGNLADHYFYQDLYVANRIFTNGAIRHVDIGSRIDGFVAHVASFREIEVFDIRPLTFKIPNVKFIQADFMDDKWILDDFADSISCLHALEHFGLGRYGDPLNPDGHILGLQKIHKMLKQDGKFYFSSPIGPLRVEFNAHRVFSVSYLLDLFESMFKLDFFSYIDDKKMMHINVPLTKDRIQTNFDCNFGCGIFELTKI